MDEHPNNAVARRIVVIGGGTAGTIVANRLRRRLDRAAWRIIVIDRDDRHLYQPGLLFVPFGRYGTRALTKSRRGQFAHGIEVMVGEVERVDPNRHTVAMQGGEVLAYDILVIASGATPRPDKTPGMLSPQWRRSIFDFYTLDGALALREALARWRGGRLVVHVVDMPIKCPVAPLEFCFLADAFLGRRGVRAATEITYATPLDGAFTKPVAAEHLGALLGRRRIHVESDFFTDFVDDEKKELVSVDERRIPFDLLVTVPLNMGAEFIATSGLGDELNFVPVDRHTLAATCSPDIFVIGDASDIPTSKAGSTAHFAAHTVVHNVLARIGGRDLARTFDGHANCFVETGNGRGLLIDFNYDVEPLPGRFPVPGLGPFPLLAESRINHLGKLAFRWMYWHLLLRGRPIPIPDRMTTRGKTPAAASASPRT
jgi:sulfide:quinone oxidoreductase